MVYGRKNTAIRKSAATRYSVQAAKPGTRFVRCEIIITTPCPPAQEDISPPTFVTPVESSVSPEWEHLKTANQSANGTANSQRESTAQSRPDKASQTNCECESTRNETRITQKQNRYAGNVLPVFNRPKSQPIKIMPGHPLKFQEIESHQQRTVHAIGNLPAMM